ncbi:MAG: response regulator [Candidatus Omnitrophica bacterium]|nr:response regulator [Candidatus Omnitrophota bacterium]
MPKKILIIDDEAGIVEEVKLFLEEEGYAVVTADSAKDGITALLTERPDLLILDMKLPDASGLEVLKVSKEKCPKTKVIVNTGYVDQKIIDEAEELGRDVFLQKPFNLLALKEEIDKLI